MLSVYLRIFINIWMQVMIILVFCKTLAMRSNAVFVILSILGSGLGIAMQELGILPMVRALVLGPLVSVVLPVACSTGPLRVRLSRSALILTSMFVASFAVSTILFALGLNDVSFTQQDLKTSDAAWLASLSCFSTTFILGGTAHALGTPQDGCDSSLETPGIILLLWSDVLDVFISNQLRTPSSNDVSILGSFLGLLYALLSLSLAFAVLTSTRKAAQSQRVATNKTMTERQALLVREEVETAVRSSLNVRRLRHDLSNQVGVVCELARSGRRDEADRYLADLQTRAQALAEQTHA